MTRSTFNKIIFSYYALFLINDVMDDAMQLIFANFSIESQFQTLKQSFYDKIVNVIRKEDSNN